MMMKSSFLLAVAIVLGSACGGSGSQTSADNGGSTEGDEFQLSNSTTAGEAHGEHPSQIVATPTHAAMRLFVVAPETGPVTGVVMKLTGADGHPYYTEETDAEGYAEVLVPAGQRYEIEYLQLGRRSITANVDVPAGPNQDIRLTLRDRRRPPRPRATTPAPDEAPPEEAEPVVLEGILFGSGTASVQAESTPRLDRIVEYMTHMPDVRIRISGHTDNVGDARQNQRLSEERAGAVRDYLVAHGVDTDRIEVAGYGDQRPVASNDTEEGRRQNRRIEAEEL